MRQDYALTAAQRIDARAAIEILDGTGISLEEAARRATQGRKLVTDTKVAAAAKLFLKDRRGAGLRDRSLEWYIDKIRLVVEKFGKRNMGEITRAEIIAWLPTVSKSKGSQAAAARAARALWRFAVAQAPQLTAENICTALPTSGPTNQGDAPFLTVDQVRAIMEVSGPYRSALALMLFAGIRPEEIHGRGKPPLLWETIDVVGKTIRIPGNVAKTGKPRVNDDLPETVWSWLQPGKPKEPVCPGKTHQAIMKAQLIVPDWPHDGTRHTFATYALGFYKEPGRVSMWLGHEGNPSLLHRTYRGLTTKVEAERYWAILPTNVNDTTAEKKEE